MSDETLIENPVSKGVIGVLSASAQRAALTACAGAFVNTPAGRECGCSIRFHWATSGAVTQRMKSGEQYDIVAASLAALEDLASQSLVSSSAHKVGISRIALGMRKGESPPDISTPENFRQALFQARAYSRGDPAGGGTAGQFLASMLARIGALEETQAKSILRVGGYNVMKEVAEGRADFGLTQSTEIVAVDGVEISAWLPEDLQMETVYAIASGADGAFPEAQSFLNFVTGPAGRQIYGAAGFAHA